MKPLEINCGSYSTNEVPILTAKLIGHFSIDGDSNYQNDLSQLKYYIRPSNLDNVNFDLNFDYQSTHHKSTSYRKLDDILRWISDNFDQLEKPLSVQEERWLDTDFICCRGTMKTIISTPYNKRDEWIICASKYHGTIYLCKFYTDEKEHNHVNESMVEKQSTIWGKKFEQYMTADHPLRTPDPKRPLNECKEFHCMFKAKFGNHSLLYNAEVDCISSQQPITDTLVGKPIELIELKTYPLFYKFLRPQRISLFWSQSYFVNINKIICGLKDRDRIVTMIKEYAIDDLLKFSKPDCDIVRCKIFCKRFLDKVKKIVTKDHNECMYKFHWKPSAEKVHYSEVASNNEKFFFLKPWFVNKAEEKRKNRKCFQ